jgi:hypothetical protein
MIILQNNKTCPIRYLILSCGCSSVDLCACQSWFLYCCSVLLLFSCLYQGPHQSQNDLFIIVFMNNKAYHHHLAISRPYPAIIDVRPLHKNCTGQVGACLIHIQMCSVSLLTAAADQRGCCGCNVVYVKWSRNACDCDATWPTMGQQQSRACTLGKHDAGLVAVLGCCWRNWQVGRSTLT